MTSSTVARLMMMAMTLLAAASSPVRAQDMLAEHKAVLTTLGKTGHFKDGVLKVNIPSNDLKVTIAQRARGDDWAAILEERTGTIRRNPRA